MNRASGSARSSLNCHPASGSSPTALKSRVSVGNWVPTPSRSVQMLSRQMMLPGCCGASRSRGRGAVTTRRVSSVRRPPRSCAVQADVDGEVEPLTHRQIQSGCHDLRVGVVRAGHHEHGQAAVEVEPACLRHGSAVDRHRRRKLKDGLVVPVRHLLRQGHVAVDRSKQPLPVTDGVRGRGSERDDGAPHRTDSASTSNSTVVSGPRLATSSTSNGPVLSSVT